MASLPVRRRSRPQRRYSQPAPLSHRPHVALVHDVHAAFDETRIEWHLSGEQEMLIDWHLTGDNADFTPSSAYDSTIRNQLPDRVDVNPRTVGHGDPAGDRTSRRSRARAHSLSERPAEAVPFIPSRPTTQTPLSVAAARNPETHLEVGRPSSSPVTPNAAPATPARSAPLQTRSSPESPLQEAGEPSRKRGAPDSDSRRSRKTRRRLDQHEEAFRNAKTLERARFWHVAAPISPGTPLWGATIRMTVDGHGSSFRPLLFLTSRPLDINPYRGDSIVLDISPKIGPKGETPGVKVQVTNVGRFEPLDRHQLDMATQWVSESLNIHLKEVLPDALRPQGWLVLPIKPRQGSTDRPASLENTAISWEEIGLLARGATWPLPTNIDPAFCLSAFRDMIIRDASQPSRLMLVNTYEWSADGSIAAVSAGPPSASMPSPSGPPCTILSTSTPRNLQETAATRRPLTADRLWEFSSLPISLFLPASLFHPTFILPAFHSALDDALLGHELSRNIFNGLIPFDLCTTAITCRSAVPTYPARDHERFEFLGDTVLRLLCDIDLWCGRYGHGKDASDRARHLQELHTIQSNANLLQLSLARGIVPYIRTRHFLNNHWRADIRMNDMVAGEISQSPQTHPKVGADVIEALIAMGFVHQEGSLLTALKVMDRIGVQLRHHAEVKNIAQVAGSLIRMGYPEPTDPAAPGGREDIAALRERVDMKPQVDPPPPADATGWLDCVSSILGHRFKDIGDAYRLSGAGKLDPWASHRDQYSIGHQVIYTFVVCDLYHRFPWAKPWLLSKIAQSRVTRDCLGAFCVLSGLADTIPGISVEQTRKIGRYKHDILAARQSAESESLADPRNFWAKLPAPETLIRYVRAIFADLLCDEAYSFKAAHAVFLTRLRPFFELYCEGIVDEVTLHRRRYMTT